MSLFSGHHGFVLGVIVVLQGLPNDQGAVHGRVAFIASFLSSKASLSMLLSNPELKKAVHMLVLLKTTLLAMHG